MAFDKFFSAVTQGGSASGLTANLLFSSIDLPGSADLTSLSAEAESIVKFVRYRLGESAITTQIRSPQIYSAFEEANIEYAAFINSYQIKSNITQYYGLSRDFTNNDLTNKFGYGTLDYMKRLAQPFTSEARPAVGGTAPLRKAKISTNALQQEYNIYTDVVDTTTNLQLGTYLDSLSASRNAQLRDRVEFTHVYHYSPTTLYRFYDPYSSINLLSQDFQFESFNVETVFYVLPLWTDILRAQQLELSDRVRRSNYSWNMVGNTLRIYPPPTKTYTMYLDYRLREDPFNPGSSLSGDSSVTGISNLSNVPVTDIEYRSINSVGRRWIRQYTLAICMEIEGRIRSKYSSIPIPGSESISLDGPDLIQSGKEKQDQLKEELKELLESLTKTEVLRREQEAITQIFASVPSGAFLLG